MLSYRIYLGLRDRKGKEVSGAAKRRAIGALMQAVNIGTIPGYTMIEGGGKAQGYAPEPTMIVEILSSANGDSIRAIARMLGRTLGQCEVLVTSATVDVQALKVGQHD